MKPTFSLVVNHTPWRPERVKNMRAMLLALLPLSRGEPFWVNDADHRGKDWQGGAKLTWHLDQWRWAAAQDTTHHLFMTDDLAIAPHFWRILEAMVTAVPSRHIGLLSNHPRAVETARAGNPWYRTASWLVGPCYCVPHELFVSFLDWYESQPRDSLVGKTSWNDDNSQNEWIVRNGPGETYHPLPTIIENDSDGLLSSTVGHGDRYSKERLSWRREQWPEDADPAGNFKWMGKPHAADLEAMTKPEFWARDRAPMLPVGEG